MPDTESMESETAYVHCSFELFSKETDQLLKEGSSNVSVKE